MKTINKLILFSSMALASVCFSSCQKGILIDKTVSIPENGWTRDEFIPFHFTVLDTSIPYNFYFSMRHHKDYPFMNAFFLLYTRFPNKEIKIDTIECILSDYQGKWIGTGIGNFRTSEFLVKSPIKFSLPGEYTIRVKQALRIDTVKDIANIGINIRPY